MAKAVWIVDGILWLLWVLVMAHIFPVFGQTFVDQRYPLNAYSLAFVRLGGILDWKPLTGLLLAGGVASCWKLAIRPNHAGEANLPAMVLLGLLGLWALTVVALVYPMFQ
jgi:hypothetical protein